MVEKYRPEEYFAGLLKGSEKTSFERHLATCEFCQKRLQWLRQLDVQLRRQLDQIGHAGELSSDQARKLVLTAIRRAAAVKTAPNTARSQ